MRRFTLNFSKNTSGIDKENANESGALDKSGLGFGGKFNVLDSMNNDGAKTPTKRGPLGDKYVLDN